MRFPIQLSSSSPHITRAWKGFASVLVTPFGRLALVYLTLLALAECLVSLIVPRAGLVLHGAVLIALLVHASVSDRSVERNFLHSLALAPLIRLLSLTVPLAHFPYFTWYILIGAPLFVAVYIAVKVSRLNGGMLGLRPKSLAGTGSPWLGLPLQMVVAASGLILGLTEYYILRPAPLASAFTWSQVWLPALILLVFTGFLEEVIFRGAMQYTAIRSLGRFGVIYVSAVFAVLHFGYRSFLDIIFVFGVAVYFGWVVQRTGSLLGVTLAHGATNITLFLVFPFLLAPAAAPVISQSKAIVVPELSSQSALPTPPATVQAVSQLTSPPVLIGPAVVPERPTAAPLHWQPYLSQDLHLPGQRPTSPPTPSTTLTTEVPAGFPDRTPRETNGLPISDEGVIIEPTTNLEPQNASPTPCGPPTGWLRYIVQRGDSLSVLSRAVGASLSELRSANCLGDSDQVYTGMALYLPSSPRRVASATALPTWTPIPLILSPTATPVLYSPTPLPPTLLPATPTSQPPMPLPTRLPPATPTSPPITTAEVLPSPTPFTPTLDAPTASPENTTTEPATLTPLPALPTDLPITPTDPPTETPLPQPAEASPSPDTLP